MSERHLVQVLVVAVGRVLIGMLRVGSASSHDLSGDPAHGREPQLLGQPFPLKIRVVVTHYPTVVANLSDGLGGFRAKPTHRVHDQRDQLHVPAPTGTFIRTSLAALAFADGPVRVMGMFGGPFTENVRHHPVVRGRASVVPVVDERVRSAFMCFGVHLHLRASVKARCFH